MRIAGEPIQDSIVDGPGLRFTVFTQGCNHHCIGCHNPETHDFNGGREVCVHELIELMLENSLTSGLTLSGGDPMEQPEDCCLLAQAAHRAGLNVWTYTGYTWEEIMNGESIARQLLLRNSDVLVDGKFVLSMRSLDLDFRGSKNQRLINVKASLDTNKVITL